MLQKGQFDIKLFNNLYTQRAFFNSDGKRVNTDVRGSYFSSSNQFFYGINSRVNPGFELITRSVFVSQNHNPISVLHFWKDAPNYRFVFSSVAPKIKFAPFKKWNAISFESGLFIPIAPNQAGNAESIFVAWPNFVVSNKVLFDHQFSYRWQFFSEFGNFVFLPNPSVDLFITNSVKGIGIANWNSKFSTYGLVELAVNSISQNGFYNQWGLGNKYRITNHLELEVLATKFLVGQNQGAGATYNLGMRYLW